MDNNFYNSGNENFEKMAETMLIQAQLVYKHVKDIKEIHQEMKLTQNSVKKSEENIMKVGTFLIDFYNEYREHDALTMAQVKQLKEAQHYVTSTITKILCPKLPEIRKKGNEYLIEWVKVNRGLWSIFKRNVNGVNVPYDRTPKIKFEQALDYVKSLTIADYLAYRDERWDDITGFSFTEPLDNEKITIEKVIEDVRPKLKLVESI